MNFALDLLDSLAQEAPAAVMPLVARSAEAGNHLVVRRWVNEQLDSGQMTDSIGAGQPDFVRSMLALAASSEKPGSDPAASKAFSHWVEAAHAGMPNRVKSLSELLQRCIDARWPLMEHTGRDLLGLGADPLFRGRDAVEMDKVVDLAGVKFGLQERNTSLIATCLARQHPLSGDLIEKSSSGKAAWPIVAEVLIDGQVHSVNAAGYCLALGDIKMLREVCKRTRADDHKLGQGLGHAIEFALSSGLTHRCTPEVAEGIAVCIAHGADLDQDRLGQRLISERMILAEEVSGHDHTDSPSYLMAALFMSTNNGREALSALSRLVNDYALPINGPVTEQGHRASLLHYAAASGQPDLVAGLVRLGADANALDVRGFSPAGWAQVFDRPSVQALLDPKYVPRASEMSAGANSDTAEQAVKPQSHEPMRDIDGPHANAHIDGDWPSDDWEAGVSVGDDADDAAEMALMSAQEAGLVPGGRNAASASQPVASPAARASTPQVQQSAPQGGVDRDRVAPAMSEAQASRGAAMFARLRSSQAVIAEQTASPPAQAEAAKTAEVSGATEPSMPRRMGFRSK